MSNDESILKKFQNMNQSQKETIITFIDNNIIFEITKNDYYQADTTENGITDVGLIYESGDHLSIDQAKCLICDEEISEADYGVDIKEVPLAHVLDKHKDII